MSLLSIVARRSGFNPRPPGRVTRAARVTLGLHGRDLAPAARVARGDLTAGGHPPALPAHGFAPAERGPRHVPAPGRARRRAGRRDEGDGVRAGGLPLVPARARGLRPPHARPSLRLALALRDAAMIRSRAGD